MEITPGNCDRRRLNLGGRVQKAGLSTPSGAVTTLLYGEQVNFGPFGSEPAITGGKMKSGWPA